MKSHFILALLCIMPPLFAGGTKKTKTVKNPYILFSEKKSPVFSSLSVDKKNRKENKLYRIRANDLEKKALLLELDESDILFSAEEYIEKNSSHLEWTKNEFLTLPVGGGAYIGYFRNDQVKKAKKRPSEKQKQLELLIEELIDGRPTISITNPNDSRFIIRVFPKIDQNERKTLMTLLCALYTKEHKTFSTRCSQLRKRLVQKRTPSSKSYKPLDETI